MYIIGFIMVLLFCVFMFFAYHAFKYRNPYKLYMCFGRKGSGKTTLMTKLALQYQKRAGMFSVTVKFPAVYSLKQRTSAAISSHLIPLSWLTKWGLSGITATSKTSLSM